MPKPNNTIFYTCVCVKATSYSLMDISCIGFCPFLPWYPQLPVWHPLTWRQPPRLYQQSQMVQPLSLQMSGFAWEKKIIHFKACPCQKSSKHTHTLFFFLHLPGLDFSSSRSAGIKSQWLTFFSHGRADETIFKCEHCNRTGLLAHAHDLNTGKFISDQENIHIYTHWAGADAYVPGCAWWILPLQSYTSPGSWF